MSASRARARARRRGRAAAATESQLARIVRIVAAMPGPSRPRSARMRSGLPCGEESDRCAEHLDAGDVGTGAVRCERVDDEAARAAFADAVLDRDHEGVTRRVGDHRRVERLHDPHVPHGAVDAARFELGGRGLSRRDHLADGEQADLGLSAPPHEPSLQTGPDLVVGRPDGPRPAGSERPTARRARARRAASPGAPAPTTARTPSSPAPW